MKIFIINSSWKPRNYIKTMATHLFSLTNSHSLLIAMKILGIYRLTNASFSWGVSILSSLNSLLVLKALVIVYINKNFITCNISFWGFDHFLIIASYMYVNFNEIPSSIGSPSNSTKHKRTVNSPNPCKKSEPGSNYLKKRKNQESCS